MEDRELKQMKSGCYRLTEFPEEIWLEMLARLPFRSIIRFKAVCRRWREVTETMYFRRKFLFAHRNSSSSWSIMHGKLGWPYGEVVGFYGCQRYGIPRSLDSYIPPHETVDYNLIIACVDGLVLLQTISSKGVPSYSVGNPVLNQWVQLPPHPSGFNSWARATGLVTRVEDGVVVEYKVVFVDEHLGHFHEVEALRFEIYSSKTGKWIRKRAPSSCVLYSLSYTKCMSLNKKLHWLDGGSIVAYDFFDVDELQKCRVIPLPDAMKVFGRTYSTSGGFLVYIIKINSQWKIWRLEEYTSDSGRWQLIQNINLTSFGLGYDYFPLAMHPFETHIMYMGAYKKTVVSIDLRTHKCKHHTKSSTFSDKMLSHYKRDASLSLYDDRDHRVFYAPQFILPQWMESVPHLSSV